ncbi:MAG: ABC transporter ATP-binding protein [Candidatus Lambdaproteobacteria bacterium]|nr:ABC transporter ATP-binding protein [Candidatus Lambdaproteobacteria bacterium]
MSAGAAGAPLLEVRGLRAGYGPIEALRGIDLDVRAGELLALIGANGAGKTTLLMTLSGVVRPWAGRIRYAGEEIGGLPPYRIMRRGIAQVPEGRRIFPQMTVRENLRVGAATADPAHWQADLARVEAVFPVLAERAGQAGGTLSGGEQQMLAIARALMSRPRLLLLDEPSLGLAPLVVKRIFGTIAAINREGTTIVLVEQNAYAALQLAHRACVLATGEIVLRGTGRALLDDAEVRRAYLGG